MQREFKISLSQEYYSDTVFLSQYDSDYDIVFNVVNNYASTNVDGMTAKFNGTRCDGLGFEYASTGVGTTFTFTIDLQISRVSGTHTGEIVIYNTDGLYFGSANVQIVVEPSAHPEGTIDAGTEAQRTVVELFHQYEGIFTSNVDESVQNWLDVHPEATTTVQDGAITKAKLSTDLQERMERCINPDDFDGDSDYEKIQNAVDYAISNNFASILIDRKYDITGSSIYCTKGLYQDDTRLRKRLTFIGDGQGAIYKGDTGYIFTAESFSGDFACINMAFIGNSESRCDVFDCHRLIRIATYSCNYNYVGWVFDGSLTTGATDNMQSIANFGDLCTYSTGYYNIGYLWGATVYGCTIEQCDYGFKDAEIQSAVITTLKIVQTTIEGCAQAGITFSDALGGISSLTIRDCYFEANNVYDIYINCSYVYSTSICDNKFTPSDDGHCIDILVRNSVWDINNNYAASSTGSGAYLIYIRTDANQAESFKIFGVNLAVGSITLTNNDHIYSDLTSGGIIKRYSSFSATGISANANVGNSLINDAIVAVSASDAVSNLPSDETDGFLINHYYNGNALQLFIGKASNAPYIRTRVVGVGWRDWAKVGAYSFHKSGLSSGTTVTLPHSASCASLITFSPIYNTSANVISHYPAVTVAKGATTFTFYALASSGSASTATNIDGYFMVTPIE